MDENKSNNMKRSKFFKTLGLGVIGLTVLKSMSLKSLVSEKPQKKISVKLNSLAVKREPSNKNNG
jgi:hypothetical protein